MKKIIFLFLLTAGLYFKSFTQTSTNPYYDAKFIKDSCLNSLNKFKGISNLTKILRNYYPSITADDSIIKAILNTNPFLSSFLPSGGISQSLLQSSYLGYSPSSIGGLNVTNFADGLAKFLVQRFKDELSLAFFSRFKKIIQDPKYLEFQTLFPQTGKALLLIDKDIYQYNSYLNILRDAFIKDLTNLYTDFKQLIKLKKYQAYFNSHPELNTVITNALYFINSYASGVHPGDVLNNYNVNDINFKQSDSDLQQNVRSLINIIKVISNSLKSSSSKNYWVPADSVRMLLDNPTGRNIYFGLIYQLCDTINFRIGGNDCSFDSILKNAKDSIDKYKNFVETFIDHAQEVNEYLSSLKDKKKADIDYNDYYNLFNSSLDLINDAFSILELPFVKIDQAIKDSISIESNRLIYVARSAGELYVDIRTKNYSSAILNILGILDTVMVQFQNQNNRDTIKQNLAQLEGDLKKSLVNQKGLFKKCKIIQVVKKYVSDQTLKIADVENDLKNKKITDANVKTLVDSIIAKGRNLKDIDDHKMLIANIFKYGTFIATVATAQNSTDVQNAIQSVALPAGSFTVKQHSCFNISVNAYVGYAFDLDLKGGFSSGIYAPVGVSFNWGLGKNKNWGAASIFVSVLDVGAVVSYRFKDTVAQLKQDVRLESILSPSIQFIYEIPNLPVAVCAGWRQTPRLFYSSSQSFQTIVPKNVLNISLLVDIPLINVLNKPKLQSN